MRDSLFEDRIASKKRLHGLTDARGAPQTQYGRRLWLNRIQQYAENNRSTIDHNKGPDYTMIIRFINTVVKHIKAREAHAHVPMRQGIKRGIGRLCSALVFEYPNFTLSKHESVKIDAVVDELAMEGKLERGRRRKANQWVGVAIIEKMCRCWLQAALDEGCLSWDIVIHKVLCVALQTALAARSGDITLSKGYTTEYMQWSDLVMKLSEHGDALDDIELTCTLRFEKNKKLETNDDRDLPLKPLSDASLNVICPVKLLLIQALRSGNLSSSLDETLKQASLRRDRTIQWLYPERPVLPQLLKSSAFIAWDKPAGPGQVNKNTKDLGLVAGVLAHIISHDVRRGGLRDLANLKIPSAPMAPMGVASKEVAVAAGHSMGSYLKGTTDKYVGPVERENYTARAAQMFVSRKAPEMGQRFQKTRLTKAEVSLYCEEHDIDPTDKNGRQRAGDAIHRKRKADWIESEKKRPKLPTKTLKPSSSKSTFQPLSVPSPLPTTTTTTTTLTTSDSVPTSLIDPRLLLLDGDAPSPPPTDGAAHDEDAAAQRLCAMIYDDVEDAAEDEQAMVLDIFLENIVSKGPVSVLTLPGPEFVNALSRINCVRNVRLQEHLRSLDEHLPQYCPMGNSRDYPTMFVYRCSNCDTYTTQRKQYLEVHQLSCTRKNGGEQPGEKQEKQEKQKESFPCTREGCTKVLMSVSSLQAHVAGDHIWEPKACHVAGCTNDRVFQKRNDLSNHLQQFHRPIAPPIHCSFPGCTSQTLWDQMHKYTQHLKLRHRLAFQKDQKPYLPEGGPSQRLSSAVPFRPTACLIPIAGSPTCEAIWKHASSLTRHLSRGVHALSLEEAQQITMKYTSDNSKQST
ncbi:hypothetical protein ONS95_000958 [Cadophora gregata]|uniref:uncharacterized protein n=1 Tax=Cadophora gregata TaxID=51156 RepID=UPI0026DD87EC|nr:uncharacterized protein ONS95_000958 [Cadophora gregata]KAK0129018.1 hypothetical protein ONS95_000958 [Cadophora gregata]